MGASDRMPGGAGRNRELDWLRAYAILLVLAEHADMVSPYATAWSGIVHIWYEGRTGVDLFFVISGFVISGTFLPTFDAAVGRGPFDAFREAVAFYIKRLVRLWPAAAAWSALTLGAALAFAELDVFPAPVVCFRKFVAALLYSFNWSEVSEPTKIGYFYSLATEMQFYTAFPVVLYAVRGGRRRCLLASVVFLLGFGGCFGIDARPQLRFGGIVAGVALFLVRRSRYGCALEPALLARPAQAAAFTLAALLALATCEIPLAAFGTIASHVATLLSCLLVGAASFRSRYLSSLGLPGLLDWVGSRSYSIYVCHIPVMLTCRSLLYAYARQDGTMMAAPLLPECLLLIIPACAVVACSELTYRLLERPFQVRARTMAAGFMVASERPRAASPALAGSRS